MKLFIVTQWGNNSSPEGPDDPWDTTVLVRASDRIEAIRCADEVFRALPPHDRIIPGANVVIEIGTDRGHCHTPRVLLGPVLVRGGGLDFGYSTYWNRLSGHEEWEEHDLD